MDSGSLSGPSFVFSQNFYFGHEFCIDWPLIWDWFWLLLMRRPCIPFYTLVMRNRISWWLFTMEQHSFAVKDWICFVAARFFYIDAKVDVFRASFVDWMSAHIVRHDWGFLFFICIGWDCCYSSVFVIFTQTVSKLQLFKIHCSNRLAFKSS